MRVAEARRQASVIINTSIKFSAGGFVDCTMNTSRPRTFSINSTLTSPSLKRPTSARPNVTFKCRGISCASVGFALPVNTAIVNASNSLLCDMGLSSKLAGVEGFEPPYGGIKTRCLTAWRHPNLDNKPRPDSAWPQSFKQGRVIQSTSQKAFEFGRHLAHDFSPKIHGLTGQKHTSPSASHARRTKERQPIERMCNLRITASHHAQAIVPSTGRQETVNCDGRRIPCQFRILKYLSGADKDIWL